MGKSIELYCTHDDLVAVTAAIEGTTALCYVRAGHHERREEEVFFHCEDIPGLGVSAGGLLAQTATEPAYLVMAAGGRALPREVRLAAGGVAYAFDQLSTPDSVTLKPGGLVREASCLVAGQVGTVSNTTESARLYKLFSDEIRRQFRKIGAYRVGPEAASLLRNGFRLTVGVQASRSLDLRSPPPPKAAH